MTVCVVIDAKLPGQWEFFGIFIPRYSVPGFIFARVWTKRVQIRVCRSIAPCARSRSRSGCNNSMEGFGSRSVARIANASARLHCKT